MKTRQNQIPQNTEKLREIPKLARRYAESRTAPLIIFSLISIVLFGGASLGVYCFLKGKFVLAVIMMVLYVAGFLCFVITWDRHEARYFTKTGIPQSQSVQQIRKFLPLPLILFVVNPVCLSIPRGDRLVFMFCETLTSP